MESYKKSRIALFLIALSGLLFSGYLSGVKFFSETCAFGESCPYFLGYPACYYGFGMYLTLFIITSLLLMRKIDLERARRWVIGVSVLGVCFAGYFTLGELPKLFNEGLTAYVFGLPTCALGLIFYTLILVISVRMRSIEG